MSDPTWRDLPSGQSIDVCPDSQGDVTIRFDGDAGAGSIYMGWRQAIDVAQHLLDAALAAEIMERPTLAKARKGG